MRVTSNYVFSKKTSGHVTVLVKVIAAPKLLLKNISNAAYFSLGISDGKSSLHNFWRWFMFITPWRKVAIAYTAHSCNLNYVVSKKTSGGVTVIGKVIAAVISQIFLYLKKASIMTKIC